MIPSLENNCMVVYDSGRNDWLYFRDPIRIYNVYDLESVTDTLLEVETLCKQGKYHAAGIISYEAAPAFDPALATYTPGEFPFIWFGIYQEPVVFKFPSPSGKPPETPDWKPGISESEYRSAIRQIKEYIRAGDTYQVNFTYRLTITEGYDPWELFVQMIHAQGHGFGAFVKTEDWIVCSASPELLFRLDGDELVSRPMKGTMERGLHMLQDRNNRDWLRNSEKDRAENLMILDMVRNDMGRVAVTGTVKTSDIFRIEKYPTVWQMTSTVSGKTGVDITEIIGALFPAASITGAPKARTMEIIRELESSPRKIYTGSIGYFSHNRTAQFNVAIRTALFHQQDQTAEYGVGGGIVWDSAEGAELRESHLKARILTHRLPEFALLETISWRRGEGYFLLDAHLDRMVESADFFSRTIDTEKIRRQLGDLAENLSDHQYRVRLLAYQDGRSTVEASRITEPVQHYRIRLACTPVNMNEDVFLYHKTTHRAVYDEALAACPGFDDVILWNTRGEITETCIANIIVEMDGQRFTPPVECGLLAGTFRNQLLSQGQITERVVHIRELEHCSRILLINSVRGMWQVELATDTAVAGQRSAAE